MASQDTEITLGTGKMLALFFGLVMLCAVFFGLGFTLGKTSARPYLSADSSPGTGVGARQAAAKPPTPASSSNENLTFYKAVEQNDPTPSLSEAAAKTAASPQVTGEAPKNQPPAPDPMVTLPSSNGYFVQVAAVSKQDDAKVLVEALRKKQYAAFASNGTPSDKLFHVQIGPFGDIKDAEVTRAKLISDGYNPILKK
jgi:DedD protein